MLISAATRVRMTSNSLHAYSCFAPLVYISRISLVEQSKVQLVKPRLNILGNLGENQNGDMNTNLVVGNVFTVC